MMFHVVLSFLLCCICTNAAILSRHRAHHAKASTPTPCTLLRGVWSDSCHKPTPGIF